MAQKNKQNAIDLCIQILFWASEENEFKCQQNKCKKNKKKRKKDDRLCKFELIDVHKMESLVLDTLAMLGINKQKLQHEKKRFLKKYPHYSSRSGASVANVNSNINDDDRKLDKMEYSEDES